MDALELESDSYPKSPDEVDSALDKIWEEYRRSRSAEARNWLVEYYRSFSETIARSVYGSRAWTGLEIDDCLQYAIEGLIVSIERYDRGRGASFRTYSSYRIRGAVLNGLDQYSEEFDYAAYKRRSNADKLKSIRETNQDDSGKGKTALERISDVTVELALSYMLSEIGAGDDIVDDSPYASLDGAVLRKQLLAIVKKLSESQKEVIEKYYFEGVAFVDIAGSMGVSKARVSQIHGAGLKAIHQHCVEKSLLQLI